MRIAITASCLCLSAAALAQPLAQPVLSPADETAAFRAAGFTRAAGQWRACEDPGTDSYSPGAIDQVADLNGDGRPEAIISEGSSFCYGMQGSGYALVSKGRANLSRANLAPTQTVETLKETATWQTRTPA